MEIEEEIKKLEEEINKLQKRLEKLKEISKEQITYITGPRAQDMRLLPVPKSFKNSFPYRQAVKWVQNGEKQFIIEPINL
jgi:vacuolar-type H+-ATPase subunit I/STV1